MAWLHVACMEFADIEDHCVSRQPAKMSVAFMCVRLRRGQFDSINVGEYICKRSDQPLAHCCGIIGN